MMLSLVRMCDNVPPSSLKLLALGISSVSPGVDFRLLGFWGDRDLGVENPSSVLMGSCDDAILKHKNYVKTKVSGMGLSWEGPEIFIALRSEHFFTALAFSPAAISGGEFPGPYSPVVVNDVCPLLVDGSGN